MEVSYAKRKKSLILTLGLATLVIQAIAMRVRAHSTFRVQPPMNIGAWEIKSIPLSSEAMSALGNPDVDGWNYTNALDELVTIQVVSPLADAESKILMMTWVQHRSGTCKPVSSSGEQSLVDRLRINIETLVQPEPYCLVRVYMAVPKWDSDGQQSQRTVRRVADAIQAAGGKKP
jgi:hypothetical protein